MELIIVQIVILVFLLTYLWAEEQAEVTIVYNYTAPEYVWEAYDREVQVLTKDVFEAFDRYERHNYISSRMRG
jgi:hypothetical protein